MTDRLTDSGKEAVDNTSCEEGVECFRLGAPDAYSECDEVKI